MKKTGKFIAVLLALVFVFASVMPAVTAFADDGAVITVMATDEPTPETPVTGDPDTPETLVDTPEDPAQDEPELNAFQKFLINILEKIGNFLGGEKSDGVIKFITWLINVISGKWPTQPIDQND